VSYRSKGESHTSKACEVPHGVGITVRGVVGGEEPLSTRGLFEEVGNRGVDGRRPRIRPESIGEVREPGVLDEVFKV
jgi:hypothetical protein